VSEVVLLAFFEFGTALLNVIKLGMEGQSPEQREKMWQWYVTDIERMRTWLKLDKETP
jgi:hypothetical protein